MDADILSRLLEALLVAMQAQTEAINALADSNMALVDAMGEADADDDDGGEGHAPAMYLDGKRR